MATENLSRVLQAHPFLADLNDEQVAFLTGCASNLRFDSGDLLAKAGERTEHTYLVRSGRVALEIQAPGRGACRIQTLEAGEVLGWSWLFPPYEWHFDARALETTIVLAFDGGCLRKKLEEDHDLGYRFLKRLIQAAHVRLERTRLQLLDVYGRKGTAP